jgi:protein-tyrosine phosphatase
MLVEKDKVLTLADRGQYILLELPHEIFIDIKPLLIELSAMGIRTIVSHPERHPVIAKQPNLLLKWLDRSAHLQVTCGSLLGDFGIDAQMAAWHLLSMGWVSLVATDSHNVRGRRPRMKTAFGSIGDRLGRSLARLVCIDNPMRILQGEELRFARDVSTGKWTNEGVRGRY